MQQEEVSRNVILHVCAAATAHEDSLPNDDGEPTEEDRLRLEQLGNDLRARLENEASVHRERRQHEQRKVYNTGAAAKSLTD